MHMWYKANTASRYNTKLLIKTGFKIHKSNIGDLKAEVEEDLRRNLFFKF